MESVKYLIIGGGVAGTTAAETIRKEDPEGGITIVSDEPHRLYSRVMLSKPSFFLGKIPFDSIWMRTESWYEEKNITFLGGRSAVKLDTGKKIVTLDDDTEMQYEKLLLAVGCPARRLPIPGVDKKGVDYLKTLDDGKSIIDGVKTAKAAVVIGGGFIGFEMCDMLKSAGLEVTSVVREPYFWDPLLDETAGRMAEKAMEKGGVKVLLNSLVQEILGGESVEGVILNDGTRIDCQMVIIGAGAYFQSEWVKDAGIECGCGIKANEYLETSAPDVWTTGDVAEFKDVILDETIQCGTWINAQMQGKTAGLGMTGKREVYRLVSSYTAHGFGTNVAFIGDIMVSPGKTTVTRGSAEGGWYGRLVILDKELIGAFLVNRNQEIAPLTKLIGTDVDVSDKLDALADPATDLNTLLES